MAFCTSCGSELTGRYCASCGVPAVHPYPGSPAVEAPPPPLADDTGPTPPTARWPRRRRLTVGAVVVAAAVGVSVPAALAYQDRRDQQQRESAYLTKVQTVLADSDLVSGPIDDALLLDVGRDMCGIYAGGGDLGAAMDAYSPDSNPGPADETVEEFIDRVAEPLTQIMASGVIAAGAATLLCPEHGILTDDGS